MDTFKCIDIIVIRSKRWTKRQCPSDRPKLTKNEQQDKSRRDKLSAEVSISFMCWLGGLASCFFGLLSSVFFFESFVLGLLSWVFVLGSFVLGRLSWVFLLL